MPMAEILKAITVIFEAIKLIIGVFRKLPTEKIESQKQKLNEAVELFRKTGRPSE